MPTYNYLTLAQAQQQLANRLFDSGMQFWTPAELTLYLDEALRTWNALTAYWRGDFPFQSTPAQTWYDLTSLPGSLRPLTLYDTDLYTIIEYHLLEPPVGVNPWTGSAQFSADDLINAVQRRRDEILSACACTITRRTVPAVAGRIQLPDTVIDIRRMAYLPSSLFPAQSPSVMWPEDTWAEQSFNRNYTITPAGTPSQYLQTTQPPIAFDVDRPPAWAGSYELLTVEAGPLLTPATPQLLSVPDDWTHVIKWGALADLLSRESNAKDDPRAQYCEQRYRMGVKLLANAPALLALRAGSVPIQLDAVRAADLYQTGWQAQPSGAPSAAYESGLNLLALAPVPATGPFGFLATVVTNAPVPVAPTDPVQVGRDDLDAILDMAQHLAAFKQGGSEFTDTLPLFQRFLKQAATYGLKLSEIAEYTSALLGISGRESDENPTMAPEPAATGAANV